MKHLRGNMHFSTSLHLYTNVQPEAQLTKMEETEFKNKIVKLLVIQEIFYCNFSIIPQNSTMNNSRSTFVRNLLKMKNLRCQLKKWKI